jgi:NAD(P)-dependent dehydrogenase (short-subunit alcohol dehydrogenase family)
MIAPDVSWKPVSELISLAGRSAVITGGANGIGLAIARRFVEAHASVLIADIDGDRADAAAEELRAAGAVVAGTVDVSDEASVVAVARDARRVLGAIDIWVNNAGIFPTSPVLDMSVEEWDRVLDVNLRGAFVGSREAGRAMVEQGRGGVILNVASTAGFQALPNGLAHYVSSKHGLIGLTKALAVELGTHGIRVLAIAPSATETPGVQRGRETSSLASSSAHIPTKDRPLGRRGVPDDVARVALCCASDLAVFMTGSVLLVDGGQLALL